MVKTMVSGFDFPLNQSNDRCSPLLENHGEAKCRGHDSAGAPSGLDGLPPGPSSAAAIFHREDGDDGEKWWFNGGLMVVQWWFNGGSMVVQWWVNGGSYKVVPQFGIAKLVNISW